MECGGGGSVIELPFVFDPLQGPAVVPGMADDQDGFVVESIN